MTAHGCQNCKTVFTVQDYYRIKPYKVQLCPYCGNKTVVLGALPATSEKDGLFYLVGGINCMGPYPTSKAAQADIWAWFGDATRQPPRTKVRGLKERDANSD